jgi:hypothetical protein
MINEYVFKQGTDDPSGIYKACIPYLKAVIYIDNGFFVQKKEDYYAKKSENKKTQ